MILLTSGILVLGVYVPIQAQSLQQLQQRQQQVEQELRSNQTRLDQLRQQEGAARQRLGTLEQNIQLTNTTLEDYQFRLEQAQKALATAEAELEKLEAKLQTQQAGTAARLRYLQRQGAERWWALLLSSKDLNEFFDRRHQLHLLIESDRTLIADLQTTAEEVEAQRIALETQRNEIALITQELAAKKQALEEQKQIQAQLIERLASQRAAYEAAQNRLAQDSQQLSGLIQSLIAEQERRQREAEQRARSQPGSAPPPVIVQGTGRLQAPVGGPITSGFGWRIHPIYRTRRFHAGIDFGVGTGTTVRAADRGTVIYAGWYGGYGNTVIISHGGGITTLYAHNSRVAVGAGQVVQRGQPIAASGSTGLSTGPHVHFEVRVNGQPVNPAGYL